MASTGFRSRGRPLMQRAAYIISSSWNVCPNRGRWKRFGSRFQLGSRGRMRAGCGTDIDTFLTISLSASTIFSSFSTL